MDELESFTDLADLFDTMADDYAGVNMSPVSKTAMEDLEQLHQTAFQQGVAADGTLWPELAESTKRAKGHGVILIEEGDLEASLTEPNHVDALREIVGEPGYQSFRYGTTDEKAPFHQAGTANMPARPPVTVPDKFPDQLAEMAADHQAAIAAGANNVLGGLFDV